MSWHAVRGWGFIRDLDDGGTIFCHHTQLVCRYPKLGRDWYKPVLYTGEYVEYRRGVNTTTNTNSNGKEMCMGVTGIRGGTLLMDHGIMRYIQYRAKTEGEAGEADTA